MTNDTTNHPVKRCGKCGEIKPLDAFSNDKNRTDGKYPTCKTCVSSYHTDYRERNRPRLLEKEREWRETHQDYSRNYRDEHKEEARQRSQSWRDENPERSRQSALDAYHRNRAEIRTRRKELYRQSPEKERQRSRIKYKNNPEKIKTQISLWKKANPEKVRLYGTARRALKTANGGRGFTLLDYNAMLSSQDSRCAYCRRARLKLVVEHMLPLVRGGPHDPDNICLACARCNGEKATKTPEEWVDRWYLK